MHFAAVDGEYSHVWGFVYLSFFCSCYTLYTILTRMFCSSLFQALLCNLVQETGPVGVGSNVAAGAGASLGPKATAVLIIVVFGSTIFFFTVTTVKTIHGSQKT